MSPSLAYKVPEADTSAWNSLDPDQHSMQGAQMLTTITLG